MRILGIETSCDETSLAVVQDGVTVLGVETLSQIKDHTPFGGVVPELAGRLHLESIHFLAGKLLDRLGLTSNDIDYIAVTFAPGLVGSLLVGVQFANGLALGWQKQIIKIHHLEAHLYSAFMVPQKPSLPALGLVVSGGHTLLVLIRDIGHYEMLGSTLDDAVGEAYDKIAKLMDLPYPGGPQIDKRAVLGQKNRFPFPRSMCSDAYGYEMSFSGLKTAVRYTLEKEKPSLIPENLDVFKNDVAASFQQAVIDTLLYKCDKAVREFNPKSLLICGGVAANKGLRADLKIFCEERKLELFVPEFMLCTDNAAMIAGLAFHRQSAATAFVESVEASSPYI